MAVCKELIKEFSTFYPDLYEDVDWEKENLKKQCKEMKKKKKEKKRMEYSQTGKVIKEIVITIGRLPSKKKPKPTIVDPNRRFIKHLNILEEKLNEQKEMEKNTRTRKPCLKNGELGRMKRIARIKMEHNREVRMQYWKQTPAKKSKKKDPFEKIKLSKWAKDYVLENHPRKLRHHTKYLIKMEENYRMGRKRIKQVLRWSRVRSEQENDFIWIENLKMFEEYAEELNTLGEIEEWLDVEDLKDINYDMLDWFIDPYTHDEIDDWVYIDNQTKACDNNWMNNYLKFSDRIRKLERGLRPEKKRTRLSPETDKILQKKNQEERLKQDKKLPEPDTKTCTKMGRLQKLPKHVKFQVDDNEPEPEEEPEEVETKKELRFSDEVDVKYIPRQRSFCHKVRRFFNNVFCCACFKRCRR